MFKSVYRVSVYRYGFKRNVVKLECKNSSFSIDIFIPPWYTKWYIGDLYMEIKKVVELLQALETRDPKADVVFDNYKKL